MLLAGQRPLTSPQPERRPQLLRPQPQMMALSPLPRGPTVRRTTACPWMSGLRVLLLMLNPSGQSSLLPSLSHQRWHSLREEL
jgi:hypothetical protein